MTTKKTRKPLTAAQRDAKNAKDRARRAGKKPAPKTTKKPVGRGKANKIVVPKETPRIKQNGFTRPKPTRTDGKPKITFRVWQIADELAAKLRRKPTRKEVLAACMAEKIKYSTFSNQFYRWRKFNGVFGRIRLDGKKAAVTGGPRKYRKGAKAKPAAKKKPAPKPASKKPVNKKPPFPVATTSAAKPPFPVKVAVTPEPAAKS